MPGVKQSLNVDAWGDATLAKLYSTGWKVVDRTIDYTLQRAKDHAPVRRIFAGQHRRKSALSPDEAAAKVTRSAFRAGARGRSIPNPSPEEGEYRSLRSWHPKGRRMDIETLPAPLPSSARKTVTAHANSMFPALRPSRDPKKWRSPNERAIGDFRRVGAPDKEGNPTLATVTARSTFRNAKGRLRHSNSQASGQSMLTSAGNWELRNKRAFYTGNDGITRLGGRLRSEIGFRVNSTSEEITMEVYSPTPYAPHQEFGTTHNRPHPFLRPALYETRERFRQWARQAYREMGLRGRG